LHFILLLDFIFFNFVVSHGGDDFEGGDGKIVNEFHSSSGYAAQWLIFNNYINFSISVPSKGWVKIGFASIAEWRGDDIIMAYWNGSSTIFEDQFKLKGWEIARRDEDIGGTYDVINPNLEYMDHHNTTFFTFSRKLDTEDLLADSIITKGNMALIWGYGGEDVSVSIAAGAAHLDFFAHNSEDTEMILIKYHGVIMCIIVMLLMTSAIVISRYLKLVFHSWFYVHAFLSLLSLVLMVISLVFIFSAHNYTFMLSWHSVIGMGFIILMGLQGIIGVYSHFAFEKYRRVPPVFPDKAHWWIGRLTFLVGLVNIVLGLWMLDYPAMSWVFYVIWCVAVVGVIYGLEKAVGQTHENAHNKIQNEGEEESKIEDRQKPTPEFLVRFFVPAVAVIFLAFVGVVISI